MDKKNVHDRSLCETQMDTYMDKTSVHVLFCDCNTSTSTEILALLQECSYKVTAVKSARQVVEALKVKGADVDILLTDVGLPQEKGFKMLKHISRQDNLSHIAIVVMSEQDDMSVVAKCLLLGAVDYLVKPLRLNEVMNLWTHTWRRRRVLELPDKQEVVEKKKLSISLPNPDTTIDFLSSYKERGGAKIAVDTGPCKDPMDREAPHLELSLRLALTYDEEKQNDEESVPSHNPPAKQIGSRSAFSLYPKVKKHRQPDEHSGNMYSSSSPISKRARFSNENCIDHNREVTGEHPAMADACSDSPTKDFSMADENRPGDTESQVCEAEPHQPPMQSGTLEERMDNVRDVAVKRMFNLQQPPLSYIHAYHPGLLESHSTDFRQGFTVNTEGESPTGKYINKPMPHSSQTLLQHPPPLHHEAGMANLQPGQNMYSYYPVTHLAVPVMGFSTWQTMVPSPPMVGGKATQAQIREAALSKFRMKRKDRCFEKKIRYASRKKVAEQRPRIRGQFVKRTALIGALENPVRGSGCNEEGGEDDEQGCSELDDNSSPEFI